LSPYRVDARMSGRHPFELYILYLAFLTGLPVLIGLAPRPGSINAVMPAWMAFGWSAGLVGGALVTLLGVYWKERATGLIAEQLGLALVGVMSLAYSICVLYVAGMNSAIPAAIIAGFGISCIRRYFQLQEVIDAVHEAEKRGAREHG
jgi:hypothetical protein